MALWARILVAALLALIVVSPAQATHGTNVFSGSWTTNIGPLAYTVISESDGASSLQSLGGQPCGAPTTYYRGFYSDQNGNGVIVACERGLGHLVGRYLHEGSQNTAGDGGLDVTYSAPGSFSGHYTADDFPGMTFTYSGTFQSHFDGDGCCPDEAPPPTTDEEEPPPSQQQVNECSSTLEAQAAQSGILDTCFTIQGGPARGKVGPVTAPKVGPKTKNLTGQIGFVDDNGNRVAGPDIAAIHAQAESAGDVCFILLLGIRQGDVEGPALQAFSRCVDVVARVLARSDQIQKRREGNQSRAAARPCATRVARGRNRRQVKPKLRVSCIRTASGVRFKIRARSRKRTLGKLLAGRRVRVHVGRSKLGPKGDVRSVAIWTASD